MGEAAKDLADALDRLTNELRKHRLSGQRRTVSVARKVRARVNTEHDPSDIDVAAARRALRSAGGRG